MSFYLIFFTFYTRAFKFRSKKFTKYYLINFISTSITSIHCNLHLWFYICASCNNTFYWNKGADRIGFYFTHFWESLFWVLSEYKNYLILPFKFWRYLVCPLISNGNTLLYIFFEFWLLILLDFILLMIVSSLLHQNVFRLEIRFWNTYRWRWH